MATTEPQPPPVPATDYGELVERARAATGVLRDAVRVGRVVEFRDRDPLVLDIHRALDALKQAGGPCETCRHGEPWYDKAAVSGRLYCRHVQDHCDVMGNGCRAWAAKEGR